MAVIHTISATQLERISIEIPRSGGAHVWLRKGITQTTDPDNGQDVYEANEVYYLAEETPTADEVEADFASLWAAHEQDGLPDVEKQASRISDVEAALIELAGLIGGE